MKRFADIKIASKLALVLACCVLLLSSLSGLSIWGYRAIAKLEDDSRDRLTKCLLADQVSRGVGAACVRVRSILSTKGTNGQEKDELARVRKQYLAALAQLKAGAHTAKDSQQAADIEEMAREWIALNNRLIDLATTGRNAEAIRQFEAESLPLFRRLEGKADEAEQEQAQMVEEYQKQRQEVATRIRLAVILGGITAVILAIFGWRVLTQNLVKPLGIAIAHLKDVAAGDLTQDAPAEFQARGDEVGLLARAKQSMIVNLRQIVKEVSGGVQILSSSSAELSANSGQMSSGSRDASDKAHTVAVAAEQMSANVTSVAAGMEQTTTNLASVSSNTDQMTATIGEIAANSERARRITDDAARQAARIEEQMNQLGQAAREIGKVTETITEISSQTNLLALNATIEAARAGSAGKGFAVVANEIKELAQQTATATEDIKARIEGVQSSTSGGIAEIEKISKVIHDVSEIVSSIAAAIEEQATTTKDIARNIAEATIGVKDANKRVSEASQATNDIAREIVTVDQAAGQMASGSEQVRSSATDLSRVAEQLQSAMARFRT